MVFPASNTTVIVLARTARRLALLTLTVVAAAGTARAQEAPAPGLPHWGWQNPLPTGFSVAEFQALPDSAAVAAAARGTLLRTLDGGHSWQVRYAGTELPLEQVSFVNPQIGWVGYTTPGATNGQTGRGELRRTLDGGSTWTLQPIGGPVRRVRIVDMQFVSPQRGFVTYTLETPGNSQNFIRFTTNGGLTWTEVAMTFSYMIRAKLVFADSLHGWLVGSEYIPLVGTGPAHVYRTTDGGLTWADSPPPAIVRPLELISASFSDARHGWVGARDVGNATVPTCYATADGGLTWQPRGGNPSSSGFYVNTRALAFVDSLRGYRVADGGFEVTADGGQVWNSFFPYLPQSAATVVTNASGVAWVQGINSGYYVSTAWNRPFVRCNQSVEDRRLHTLQFPDPTHGWALADVDTVLLRTTARGQPWQRVTLTGAPLLQQRNPLACHFVDRDTGFVVMRDLQPGPGAWRTSVIRTTDGGRTWATTVLPLTNQFLFAAQVRFANARRGVVLTNTNRLFVTQTGGRTWQAVSAGTTQPLRSLTWADSLTVLAGGDSATISRSTDGGVTWQAFRPDSLTSFFNGNTIQIPFPTGNTISPITFTTPTTGFYGDGGNYIVRTQNGGRTWTARAVPIPPGTQASLERVNFRNARDGWATGYSVYQTHDAGQTWTPLATTVPNTVAAPVDTYNGWVAGNGGGILHYSEKFVQTDRAAGQRTAYCTGDTLTVAFSKVGTFSAAEDSFRVELSNRMGRFRPRETTLLPLAGSASASPLRVVLPATLAAGTRYRLRVIRADSSVLGGDNERDVTIHPRPAAVAVAPTDSARFCAGDSVLLTAPAGFGQYQWSSGDTTRTVWATTARTYTVQVAAGGGCFGPASGPVVVRVTPQPAPPVVSVGQSGSGPAVLSAAPVLAGATYVWTGPNGVVAGASGPTLLLTGAAQNGVYTVRVTARGCASRASTPVSVVVTGLAAEARSAALTLSPNPADGSVALRSDRPISAVAVRDLAGRLVREVRAGGAQSVIVSVEAVPAGSYLVAVTLADGQVLTRRLLVSH